MKTRRPPDRQESSRGNRKYRSASPGQREYSKNHKFSEARRDSSECEGFVLKDDHRRDKNGVRTCSSVWLRSRISATVRRVSPVYRGLDGWGQRGDRHDNDTGECHAKKLEGERAARQRLTQLQCALEITVDREHAARHNVWDEEAEAMTQWLRQAFLEFGTRLQQQVRRKDLEEQAKDEDQRSRNRAEQAIWEVQNKQLEKETTKLKEQQEELVTAARRLMERSSALLATFKQRMEEVKMVLGKILLPLTVGQRQIQELRSRVEVLPTNDQIPGYLQQLASKYEVTKGVRDTRGDKATMNYEEANPAKCKRGEMKEMRTRQPEGELNGGADDGSKLERSVPKTKTKARTGYDTSPIEREDITEAEGFEDTSAREYGGHGIRYADAKERRRASGKMQRREQFQQASCEGNSDANVKRTIRRRRGGQRVQLQRVITRLVQLLFQGLHA